jgi:hypothetical protein
MPTRTSSDTHVLSLSHALSHITHTHTHTHTHTDEGAGGQKRVSRRKQKTFDVTSKVQANHRKWSAFDEVLHSALQGIATRQKSKNESTHAQERKWTECKVKNSSTLQFEPAKMMGQSCGPPLPTTHLSCAFSVPLFPVSFNFAKIFRSP